jgi:AcrR family transcriptional regulator
MDQNLIGSRRERRVAARQAQILEAAARLFAEKGYHRTTTRDIAQAADLSEGTLYNYFGSKEDLLLGILSRLVEALGIQRRLQAETQTNAAPFLIDLLTSRQLFITKNREMLQAVLSEILVNSGLRQRYYQGMVFPLIGATELHLAQRIGAGEIRLLPTPHLARLLSALTAGLFILQILEDPVVCNEWDRLAETIASVLIQGVQPGTTQPDEYAPADH